MGLLQDASRSHTHRIVIYAAVGRRSTWRTSSSRRYRCTFNGTHLSAPVDGASDAAAARRNNAAGRSEAKSECEAAVCVFFLSARSRSSGTSRAGKTTREYNALLSVVFWPPRSWCHATANWPRCPLCSGHRAGSRLQRQNVNNHQTRRQLTCSSHVGGHHSYVRLTRLGSGGGTTGLQDLLSPSQQAVSTGNTGGVRLEYGNEMSISPDSGSRVTRDITPPPQKCPHIIGRKNRYKNQKCIG